MAGKTKTKTKPLTIEEIRDEFHDGEPWTVEDIREFFCEDDGQSFVDFAYPQMETGRSYEILSKRPPAISIHLTHAEAEMTHHLMKISGSGERWADTDDGHPKGALNRSKTMQRIYRAGLLAIMNGYATCELTEKEVYDAYEYDGGDKFKKKTRKKKK